MVWSGCLCISAVAALVVCQNDETPTVEDREDVVRWILLRLRGERPHRAGSKYSMQDRTHEARVARCNEQ